VEHWWRRIQFLTALVVVMLLASAPPQPPEDVPNRVRPAPIVPVNKQQGRLLRIVVVAEARPAGCKGEAEAQDEERRLRDEAGRRHRQEDGRGDSRCEEQVETGQQVISNICRQRRRRMRRRRNDNNDDNDDNKRQH
jgi:hypothetical protein